MNILICDDMQNEVDKLTALLADSDYAGNTVSFSSGAETLDFIRSGKRVDVCFLDIVMPEMSGIDLAKELRGMGYAGDVVFLSTSRDYGPEAFEVEALNYLLKPPTPDTVRDVLSKIENARKKADTEGFLVNAKSAARFLLFRDIAYAEVIMHKIYFRLVSGESAEVTATFSETAPQLLRDKRFAQCHNSYIVNMDEISSVTGREIIMRSGVSIPVSKSYSDVKKRYLQWVAFGGDEK